MIRPKNFEILKRSGEIKTNTVYQYCLKFNMRIESRGHFIVLSLKSSWKDFGISESYDFQKFYVVSNFEFLLYKRSLSLVSNILFKRSQMLWSHLCMCRKLFRKLVKLLSVDLEILGESYNATHLSDFG